MYICRTSVVPHAAMHLLAQLLILLAKLCAANFFSFFFFIYLLFFLSIYLALAVLHAAMCLVAHVA